MDRAKLVHEARKTIKRMRALGRLLRYELGEQEFKRVNDSLRLAGQRLAGERDAQVRLATVEQLCARHPKALALDGLRRLTERLRQERAHANEPANPEEVLSDIAEMRRDLLRWNLVSPEIDALSPGLRDIYKEGRGRYKHVKQEQAYDPEHVHDWRKRVKALYYTLDMLGASQTKGLRDMTRRSKRLGEVLGEEHDLWMLCRYLECHPDACGNDSQAYETLLRLSKSRRKRLRKRALKSGARLYEPKPDELIQRILDSLAR